MTTITDMVDEVRMLELNRRIAQLKTCPLIDEECGGCAGYCDVAKLQEEIDKLRHIVENRNETVSDLLHTDNRLNMSIHEYKETIKSRDKTIECLKAELSSRGEDSKVLMDVVGIVKAWDERSGQAFPTMYELCDRLVDYIDVPDLPIIEDDSSCAEDYHVVVKVGFLEG